MAETEPDWLAGMDPMHGLVHWGWRRTRHRLVDVPGIVALAVFGVVGAVVSVALVPSPTVTIGGQELVTPDTLQATVGRGVIGLFIGLFGACLLILVWSLVRAPFEERDALRRNLAAQVHSPVLPSVFYEQRAPYASAVDGFTRHWVGITISGVPSRVRVDLTSVTPPVGGNPQLQTSFSAPWINGGDPSIGRTLTPGRETLCFMAVTGKGGEGTLLAGGFGVRFGDTVGPYWKLEERRRLTFEVVVDGAVARVFSFVLDPVGDDVVCKVEVGD